MPDPTPTLPHVSEKRRFPTREQPQIAPRLKRSRWPFARRKNRRVEVFREPITERVMPIVSGYWHRARSLTRLWIFLGLVVVLGSTGALVRHFVLRSAHFVVRTLRISPTRHVASSALRNRMGHQIGLNLFRVQLDEIRREVAQDPWIASVQVRRELPGTIAIDVIEREPSCLVALGALYLADADGLVFKRATPDEAVSLPVVTGIDRDSYIAHPESAKIEVREALTALRAWREVESVNGPRPAIGEIHLDRVLGVTIYMISGTAVRLGRVAADDTISGRLKKFDAVWSALENSVDGTREHARIIYLDNRVRADRVTVKLAQPIGLMQSDSAAVSSERGGGQSLPGR